MESQQEKLEYAKELLAREDSLVQKEVQAKKRQAAKRVELEEQKRFIAGKELEFKREQEVNVHKSLEPYSAEAVSRREDIERILEGTHSQVEKQQERERIDDQPDVFEVDADLLKKIGGSDQRPTTLVLDEDEEEGGLGEGTGGDAASFLNANTELMSVRASKKKFATAKISLSKLKATIEYPNEINARLLAQLFNTLQNNNVVIVEPVLQDSKDGSMSKEWSTKAKALSPTDGVRFRAHLDTPNGEPNILFTSRDWALRQNMMTAILEGKLDVGFLAKLQTKYEDCFLKLENAKDMLHRKDLELVRSNSKCKVLHGALKRQLDKVQDRKQYLAALAQDIKISMGGQGRVLSRLIRSPDDPIGSEHPDFSWDDDTDNPIALDGEVSVLWAELKDALKDLERPNSEEDTEPVHQQQQSASNGNGGGTLGDILMGGGGGGVSSPSVANKAGKSAVTTPGKNLSVNGVGMLSPVSPQRNLLPSSSGGVVGATLVKSHQSLVETLEKKIEGRRKRNDYQRKCQALEMKRMELEDERSIFSTMFKLGDKVYAKLRDVLKIVSGKSEVLDLLTNGGASDALAGLELAKSQLVVCPCCRFEFDPTQPAWVYRDKIIARTQKAKKLSGGTTVEIGGGQGKAGKSRPKMKSSGQATETMDGGVGGGPGLEEDASQATYAVMALQDNLTEVEGKLESTKKELAEFKAERDMMLIQSKQAQEKYEELREEMLQQKKSLNRVIDEQADQLDAKTAEIARLKASRAALKLRLEQVEKAAEVAFEEIRQVRELEAKCEAMTRFSDGTENQGLTYEEIAKTFYRKFIQAQTKLRQLGSDAVEMLEKLSGGNIPIPTWAHSSAQVDPDELIPKAEKEVLTDPPPTDTIGTAMTPRSQKIKLSIVQTDPQHFTLDVPEISSLGPAPSHEDARGALHGSVRNHLDEEGKVEALVDLVEGLHKKQVSTFEERIAELVIARSRLEGKIEELKQEIREAEEKAAKERAALQEKFDVLERKHEVLNNEKIGLEDLCQDLKKKNTELKETNEILAAKVLVPKSENGMCTTPRPLDVEYLVARTGLPASTFMPGLHGGGDDKLTPQTVVGPDGKEMVVMVPAGSGNTSRGQRTGGMFSGGGDWINLAGSGGSDIFGFSAGGDGSEEDFMAGSQRVLTEIQTKFISSARTTQELEAEEKMQRRAIMMAHRAFLIPLPLLLRLVATMKREMKSALTVARRIGQKREQRMYQLRESIHREQLKLSTGRVDAPEGEASEQEDGLYRSGMEGAHAPYGEIGNRSKSDPAGWEALHQKEFPPIVPSKRREDGSYEKLLTDFSRSGHHRPIEGNNNEPGSPGSPSRGALVSFNRSFNQPKEKSGPPQLAPTIMKSIRARLSLRRIEKKIAEEEEQKRTLEVQTTNLLDGKSKLLSAIQKDLQERLKAFERTRKTFKPNAGKRAASVPPQPVSFQKDHWLNLQYNLDSLEGGMDSSVAAAAGNSGGNIGGVSLIPKSSTPPPAQPKKKQALFVKSLKDLTKDRTPSKVTQKLVDYRGGQNAGISVTALPEKSQPKRPSKLKPLFASSGWTTTNKEAKGGSTDNSFKSNGDDSLLLSKSHPQHLPPSGHSVPPGEAPPPAKKPTILVRSTDYDEFQPTHLSTTTTGSSSDHQRRDLGQSHGGIPPVSSKEFYENLESRIKQINEKKKKKAERAELLADSI